MADIDWDEGREPEPFFTESEPCGNCGRPSESLTWIPGYEYAGCPDCVTEAFILAYAEATCETLYNAISRAKTVEQVSSAFVQHKETCPKCKSPGVTPALPEAA